MNDKNVKEKYKTFRIKEYLCDVVWQRFLKNTKSTNNKTKNGK